MSTYISYSPNDFLYVTAGVDLPNNCSQNFPTNSDCKQLVSSNSDTPNMNLCYQKALCENKDKASVLINLQNNHLGSDKRYDDTNQLYWNEMIKTANLVVGVSVLCYLSFIVI